MTATESGIWWEHQRSFTSAFQMNDPKNFLCFPISFMDKTIVLFYCMYISNMLKTMNNSNLDNKNTGSYNTFTVCLLSMRQVQ